MAMAWWVGAVILVGWVVWTIHRRSNGHGDYETTEWAHMPRELRTARLVVSEHTLYADAPVKLAARVDQVFDVGGVLVPMETKTRQRRQVDVFDVLELSVQAMVLRHTDALPGPARTVATYGYVRLVPSRGRPEYRRVPLVSEDTVIGLHRRYHALRRQRGRWGLELQGARDARTCRRCPYRAGCAHQPRGGGGTAMTASTE